jgi:integrase
LKAIPFGSSPELCPVRSIQKWLRASAITEGALFRSIGKGNKLRATRLSDRSVALIVKALVEKQGGNSEGFSGHSLRSGFVSEAAKNGSNDHEIMKQTGHRSREMVSRYVRNISIWNQNASTKLGL